MFWSEPARPPSSFRSNSAAFCFSPGLFVGTSSEITARETCSVSQGTIRLNPNDVGCVIPVRRCESDDLHGEFCRTGNCDSSCWGENGQDHDYNCGRHVDKFGNFYRLTLKTRGRWYHIFPNFKYFGRSTLLAIRSCEGASRRRTDEFASLSSPSQTGSSRPFCNCTLCSTW